MVWLVNMIDLVKIEHQIYLLIKNVKNGNKFVLGKKIQLKKLLIMITKHGNF